MVHGEKARRIGRVSSTEAAEGLAYGWKGWLGHALNHLVLRGWATMLVVGLVLGLFAPTVDRVLGLLLALAFLPLSISNVLKLLAINRRHVGPRPLRVWRKVFALRMKSGDARLQGFRLSTLAPVLALGIAGSIVPSGIAWVGVLLQLGAMITQWQLMARSPYVLLLGPTDSETLDLQVDLLMAAKPLRVASLLHFGDRTAEPLFERYERDWPGHLRRLQRDIFRIGHRPQDDGATSPERETEWQESVSLLAQEAPYIVLFLKGEPSEHVQWELNHCLAEHLEKTYLVLGPGSGPRPGADSFPPERILEPEEVAPWLQRTLFEAAHSPAGTTSTDKVLRPASGSRIPPTTPRGADRKSKRKAQKKARRRQRG